MRKIFTFLLALMATTATLFASSGTCGENVTWDLTGGVLTISGTGPMRDWNNYSTVPWRKECTSITTIIIEDGVTYIGKNAFYQCDASTAVTIPNSVTTIGNNAFRGCKFTEITLPDNLTTLGESAFAKCSSLTAITLPANVTSIGENAFNANSALKEITCEATTPPTCGDNVFGGVAGTIPVYVPAGSVAAYKAASGWNHFTNIQAKGAGSKDIYAALSGSTMTIYFDDQKASRPGVLDKWTPEEGGMQNVPDATRETITKAVIDASMVDARPIRTFCWFYLMVNLTTIDGLANLNTSEVTNMTGMFNYCTSLTSLDLGSFNTDKVETMSYMFSGSSSLTSLDVSNFNTGNVTDMRYMFNGCSSLKTIYCNDAWNPSLSDDMFNGCTALVGGKGTKYDDSKKDKTYARPDGLGGQPGYFTAKGVIWNLTGGVLTISGAGPMPDYGYNAAPWFSEHSSITSVIIEDGITSIGDGAFSNCENLLSVTIPNSVTSIKSGAFTVCQSLLAVTIPNNVTTIGTYAFNDCKALTEITIPENVTSIGECAFKNCNGLTEITCKAVTPPTLGINVFNNVYKSIPVYVPDESVSAYQAADGWSDFTNIQAMSGGGVTWSLNDGVLTISGTGPMDDYSGKAAIPWYAERKSIVSVIIEDGVRSIGKHAFNECINIASVQIAQTITSIGNYAFRRCDALTSLTIPAAVKSIGK